MRIRDCLDDSSNPVASIMLQWPSIYIAVRLSSVLEQEDAEEDLTSGQTTIEMQMAIT